MKTIKVSRGHHGWQLRIEGNTIAFFPTPEEANETAQDMASRWPDTYDYQGKRPDQVTFSATVSMALFFLALLAFVIAALYQALAGR